MKKVISSILVFILIIISLTACNSDKNEKQNEEKTFKVALVLPGTVNDKSWSALALTAIQELETDYGAYIKYSENISASDAEQVFRGYASQGFDYIIGHGYEFTDAAKTVASEYPESFFCISNGSETVSPNLGSMIIDSRSFGFLVGGVSAILSDSNNIGFILATNTPPMKDSELGYIAGAKYINADIKANVVYSGTIDDAAKVKETALILISGGADVISQSADHASLGALAACEEKNIMNVGAIGDQSEAGPNTVVINVMQDIPKMIVAAGKLVQEDKFTGESYKFGIMEKAVYLSDFTGAFNNQVTEEKKIRIQQLMDDILSGKIDIDAEIEKNNSLN